MKLRTTAIILGLAAVAVLTAHLLSARGVQTAQEPAAPPTIKFNHKYHVTEAGVECATCHPAAGKSASLADNLHPGHEQCQSCHEEQVTNTCGYCHVNPDAITPRVVPPRELKFAHAKHLAMKDVQCVTCHEGIDQATAVAGQHAPTMETCATCHGGGKATNQCEVCHSNLASLLPASHLRSDFRKFHAEEARLGEGQNECATCHAPSFCQECHGPVPLKNFGGRDLFGDPRPRTSPKDQPAQTTVQRVHDLNYRFTHGIDARARQSDCATCHDTREFCVECHRAGGNINQQMFKPASHTLPGFTTFGKGSGGGIHAQEARRDMESCVGCHDAPGEDPVCLTCHGANGQVR